MAILPLIPLNLVAFCHVAIFFLFFFFFQAEDGIRDKLVTGVQTCALPISTWKPTQSLRFDAQWPHQIITRARDGSWFSSANIPRLKIEYQLRRDIFFRYVGQYTAQKIDALRDPRTGDTLVINGTQQVRRTTSDFRNDFLFSYRPTPGTVLFFGYGASLTEADPFSFRGLSRTGDGFFLKASYLFRL